MNKAYLLAAIGSLSLLAGAAHAQVEDAVNGGPYCREYQQTLTIAGKTQKGFGTACLQEDGSWELQNEPAEAAPQLVQQGVAVPPPPANIGYVVDEGHVFVTPPEPFVVGTVFIGGHQRHFDRGFHPYHGGYHHWH